MSALLPSSKRLGKHNSTYDQEKGSKKNKKEKYKVENAEDRHHQQFTPLTLPLGEVFGSDGPGPAAWTKEDEDIWEEKKYLQVL